jgi:hypothetical protein
MDPSLLMPHATQITQSLIPHYQALPFPAPLWLLQTLLILGFFLHVLPMNFMLGGGFLASVFLLKGLKDKNSYDYKIGRGLVKGLPIYTSVAITQGIVPLLFVQLIYGPMFYTSSVLMAAPWFAIIFILLIAYFLVYYVGYKCVPAPGEPAANYPATSKGPAILTLVVALLLVIGFLFVNNMTLMLRPEVWMELYQHSANGLNLNVGDKQVPARFLHMVIGAFAVAGLLVGMHGLYWKKRDEEFATWLIKKGAAIYAFYTFLQIPIGIWFLFSLGPLSAKFLGGDMFATAVFGLSMALMAVSMIGAGLAAVKGSAAAFQTANISGILCVLAMIVNRHQLRHFMVSPYLQPESVPVSTQWDLLIVFVLSAVALIAYLVWLCKLIFNAYNSPAKVAGTTQS